MTGYAGQKVTCLACNGLGYVAVLSSGGYSYPRTCRACKGSGKQEIRA